MNHPQAKKPSERPVATDTPDMRERGGPVDGKPQAIDRRLFMQLSVFSGCTDPAPIIEALKSSGIAGALYADLNDSRGIALLTFSEDENHFVTKVRELVNKKPFSELTPKPAHAMFGRTYTIGYEPQLEDVLLHKPRRRALDTERPWVVWYPLRRKGTFSKLPIEEQKTILREHGTIGRQYGEADLAIDIRLACHALDVNDNDFIIGLIGKRLNPLSKLVERMRKTAQTSTHMEKMGPFFTGKVLWQSTYDGENI